MIPTKSLAAAQAIALGADASAVKVDADAERKAQKVPSSIDQELGIAEPAAKDAGKAAVPTGGTADFDRDLGIAEPSPLPAAYTKPPASAPARDNPVRRQPLYVSPERRPAPNSQPAGAPSSGPSSEIRNNLSARQGPIKVPTPASAPAAAESQPVLAARPGAPKVRPAASGPAAEVYDGLVARQGPRREAPPASAPAVEPQPVLAARPGVPRPQPTAGGIPPSQVYDGLAARQGPKRVPSPGSAPAAEPQPVLTARPGTPKVQGADNVLTARQGPAKPSTAPPNPSGPIMAERPQVSQSVPPPAPQGVTAKTPAPEQNPQTPPAAEKELAAMRVQLAKISERAADMSSKLETAHNESAALRNRVGSLETANRKLQRELAASRVPPVAPPAPVKETALPAPAVASLQKLGDELAAFSQERAGWKEKWDARHECVRRQTKGHFHARAQVEEAYFREKLCVDLKDYAKFEGMFKAADELELQVQGGRLSAEERLQARQLISEIRGMQTGLYKQLKQSVDDFEFSEKADINLRYDILNGSERKGMGSVKYRAAADHLHNSEVRSLRTLIADPGRNIGEFSNVAAELELGPAVPHALVERWVGQERLRKNRAA